MNGKFKRIVAMALALILALAIVASLILPYIG